MSVWKMCPIKQEMLYAYNSTDGWPEANLTTPRMMHYIFQRQQICKTNLSLSLLFCCTKVFWAIQNIKHKNLEQKTKSKLLWSIKMKPRTLESKWFNFSLLTVQKRTASWRSWHFIHTAISNMLRLLTRHFCTIFLLPCEVLLNKTQYSRNQTAILSCVVRKWEHLFNLLMFTLK